MCYKLDIAQIRKVVKKPWTTDNAVLYYDEKDSVFWTGNAKGIVREKFGSKQTSSGHDTFRNRRIQVLRDSEGNTWIATNGMACINTLFRTLSNINPDDIRGVMAERMTKKEPLGRQHVQRIMENKRWKSYSYIDDKEAYRNMIKLCKRISPRGNMDWNCIWSWTL